MVTYLGDSVYLKEENYDMLTIFTQNDFTGPKNVIHLDLQTQKNLVDYIINWRKKNEVSS